MLLRHITACLFVAICLATMSPALAATTGSMAPDDAKLTRLEMKYFAHPYAKESEPDRISRIESLVFGAVQNGSIEDRLAHLEVSGKGSDDEEIGIPVQPPTSKPERVSTLQSLDNDVDISASSSYPKVAELEQSMLGRSYLSDPIRQRLSRLETKAFGKPSNVTDLAARVDTLDQYAAVFAVPPEDRRDPLDFSGLRASTDLSVGHGSQRFVGVVDQIESLESTVFGTKHTSQPLLQRVSNLEQNIYGSAVAQGQDLTTRVSHLWASVNPTAPSLASVQGFDDTQSQDWRAQQQQLAQLDQMRQAQQAQQAQRSQPAPRQATVSHHSFLKRIGKALQVAGTLAATAISSAAMPYGYGYNAFGTGYGGYGGYPNTSFNSPGLGGFGGSFGPSYGAGGFANFFR